MHLLDSSETNLHGMGMKRLNILNKQRNNPSHTISHHQRAGNIVTMAS